MPSRGSAQFLLLFLRSRTKLGWTIGAVAFALIVAVLLQAGDAFPLLTRTGLAQLLRQSVWQHALAGLPETPPLPWAITSGNRRGGAAAWLECVGRQGDEPRIGDGQASRGQDPHLPRTKLSEVGVGDRITVTTSDGASRDYRVTGRKVVDPHLAESDTRPSDVDTTLVTCLPLDPLLASSMPRYPGDEGRSPGAAGAGTPSRSSRSPRDLASTDVATLLLWRLRCRRWRGVPDFRARCRRGGGRGRGSGRSDPVCAAPAAGAPAPDRAGRKRSGRLLGFGRDTGRRIADGRRGRAALRLDLLLEPIKASAIFGADKAVEHQCLPPLERAGAGIVAEGPGDLLPEPAGEMS